MLLHEHAPIRERLCPQAAVSRWEREPAAAACRAYCALRQELAVLRPLRHAHVAALLAVCAAPLALLLALAPQVGPASATDCFLHFHCQRVAIAIRKTHSLLRVRQNRLKLLIDR